ncbi:MAG TPA: prolyl oligopeptidase family serine peptidase [Candidatus Polarisedimenticolaceae bacterium]|nr:prolyl oligopeptidase family serine peptidase [Candidatus Polarisedimenticolaceae bacterium]
MSSPPTGRPRAAFPATPKVEAADTYHGVAVADPYRWLEQPSDPDVRAWTSAQNAHTRAYLDAWPGRAALRERIAELTISGPVTYGGLAVGGRSLFALKRQPPLEQPILVVMDDEADPSRERVLFDPTARDAAGRTSIDWFVPSPDGTTIAVSLSVAGTETGDVHLLDADGRPTGEIVPRVNGGTAGGSLAWAPDGRGFYYTRYPRPGERPDEELGFHVHVYFHALGTDPADDRFELGHDLPRIAEIQLQVERSGVVLASVQNGDGGEFQHWLRSVDGAWRAITRYADRCIAARLGSDALYFVSRAEAPRGKVLKLPLARAADRIAGAIEIVPEVVQAIEASFSKEAGLWVGDDRLYVRYQLGGPSRIHVYTQDGRPLGGIATPPLSAVDNLAVLPGGDVLVAHQSFTSPSAWDRFTKDGKAPRATGLGTRSHAGFEDCEVVREHAVSPDGTEIPISVVRRRGLVLDGRNPTILHGYGGYGVCQTPAFRGRMSAWIERGGVFAVAHIRGGGEFGERWHHEGRLASKQNVFDDFAASARALVDAGYTVPSRLALFGGSNGGLLMGAMITQHPGIAGAVVSLVGIYDMLRVEGTPNGAYNVTEFGTVEDPELFTALLAYSPYHRVTEGTHYPPVLLLAGENDPRVDAWQSKKMVARLQTASGSDAPILLRTAAAAGHGVATPLSEQVEEFTDVMAFLHLTLEV